MSEPEPARRQDPGDVLHEPTVDFPRKDKEEIENMSKTHETTGEEISIGTSKKRTQNEEAGADTEQPTIDEIKDLSIKTIRDTSEQSSVYQLCY
jgi:hypothetical protein